MVITVRPKTNRAKKRFGKTKEVFVHKVSVKLGHSTKVGPWFFIRNPIQQWIHVSNDIDFEILEINTAKD
jgi:hypothetical protein